MKQSIFISLIAILLSAQVLAVDELDQQAMLYVNIPLNADNSIEKQQFGLRVDRGFVEYGETMQLSEQYNQPAVVNIAYGDKGLQHFELHGIDYAAKYVNQAKRYGVYNASEEGNHDLSETLEDIPLGVIGGLAILLAAIAL